MEATTLVPESLLSSAQGPEVLSSLGDDIRSEFHGDTPGGLVSNGDVEKAFGKSHDCSELARGSGIVSS